MTEEQAKKTFERAMKMEQEFGEYFTGMCKVFVNDGSCTPTTEVGKTNNFMAVN